MFKNKYNKLCKQFLTAAIVVILFSLFGYWKFHNVLIDPEISLATAGDGIGWIGLLYSVDQEAREKGVAVLFGETFWSKNLGFGITAPYPLNAYWKWKIWILSRLFSADKVYELIAFLSYILIGAFGFLLFREMGISIFFSLIGVLLFTHMDHFFSRLGGHIVGVGSYYFPILLTWSCIRAGKDPNIYRLAVFSFLNALNFLGFEYYGYFGVFFSIALFFGYLLKFRKKDFPHITNLVFRFVVAGMIFSGLMCLFYPKLVFHRLYSLFFPFKDTATIIHNSSHSWEELLFYSVRNPLALFSSCLPWLSSVGEELFKNSLGEFTFRIGLILPIFILCSLVCYLCKYVVTKRQSDITPVWECLIWLIPMFLMVFFALNPDGFVSLVPITYKIAPMFRVGARAFLYVDIVLIVLFISLSDRLARATVLRLRAGHSFWKQLGRCSLLVFVLLITGAATYDVTHRRLFDRVPFHILPDTSIYKCLEGKKKGLLLELPAFSPIVDDTAETYIYFYNRTKHGFPLANIWYPPPANMVFRKPIHKLSRYLNSLSPEAILDMEKVGVSYIVVNKHRIDDAALRCSPHLQLLADSDFKSVFEVIPKNNVHIEGFLEYFIYSEPSLIFHSGFRKEECKNEVCWRWCKKNGTIIVKNYSTREMNVKLNAGFCAPVGSTLLIESGSCKDTIKMNVPRIQYQKVLKLKAKSEILLSIKSDISENPSTKNPNLIFYIFNYDVRKIE